MLPATLDGKQHVAAVNLLVGWKPGRHNFKNIWRLSSFGSERIHDGITEGSRTLSGGKCILSAVTEFGRRCAIDGGVPDGKKRIRCNFRKSHNLNAQRNVVRSSNGTKGI